MANQMILGLQKMISNGKKVILAFLIHFSIDSIEAQVNQIKSVSSNVVRVKTIHPVPRQDQFLSIEQPADVAPYYRAELYAEVAGKVIFLEKDLGDQVKSGEKIVEIMPLSGQNAQNVNVSLTAPFDGVIAARSIDPGTFVPSATIVPGARPIVVIERNDIVTISMKVPDMYSSLVKPDTKVEIRMDPLPGRVFRSNISRIAPSLSIGDRTLTVQVDLYNRTQSEFESLKQLFAKNGGSELKSRRLPNLPEDLNQNQAADLIPGMYGKMRLVFPTGIPRLFIPGKAVVKEGGVDFIYRVQSGFVRKTRVKVEFDNASFVSVIIPGESVEASMLNESDQIIVSNQSELEDGQSVMAFPETN